MGLEGELDAHTRQQIANFSRRPSQFSRNETCQYGISLALTETTFPVESREEP
jgi:hypothetical protein